ncbi:MAG: DUF86 domain-containing protein [Cyanothece sp. SIO2G6]|nr:DUF86 domain-containing protein [Cyanothece sp. SIO2G6]
MFDRTQQPLLIARLRMVLTALERIPTRFASIQQPSDFVSSDAGLERMDSICMVLIAAGEEFKKLDRDTDGQIFASYPEVSWRGAMGLRDVLAHGYFQVDPEQLFSICQDNIPQFLQALHQIIQDLEDSLEEQVPEENN